MDRAAESRSVEILARIGYASRGFVHLVIGALAVRIALNEPGGKDASMRQAVAEFGRAGRIPLAMIAVGLFGFGLWRLVQASADTERKGRKIAGLATRAHKLANGMIHFGLAVLAAKLAVGMSADTRDKTPEYVSRGMEQPFGRWAIAIVGGALIIGAISQVVKAVRAKFAHDIEGASPGWRKATILFGRVGISLRAIVFAACGFGLIMAAWHFNPAEAKGLYQSLATLREQPYGIPLFSAVAFGILAYAMYCFLFAEFRHIGHK